MVLISVFFTALLSVASLFLIAKIMGHKQIAQLDFFDYISGITIGSIAAELATELEEPIRPLIALVVYGGVSVLLSLLTHKFPRTRKFINGTPTILLHAGKLNRANLKKAKLDLSEFLLLCREQGYFDLLEIETAVFEPNGKLSVLPVSDKRPVTPNDLRLTPPRAGIGVEVILDGRVMGENLKRMGRDEVWLGRELRAQGFHDAREVFLGVFYEAEGKWALFGGGTK